MVQMGDVQTQIQFPLKAVEHVEQHSGIDPARKSNDDAVAPPRPFNSAQHALDTPHQFLRTHFSSGIWNRYSM